eukprot:TRINITY_DN628_c0_g2_i2.p1 TRINITY_DN628_c0_g2~~TRINITY_DN628_c0_g2_i2.p1  ORF type:complete len:288 (-),score=93.29 TRINITY_DN628_c0_g2_i2:809-1582(-)
MARRRDAARLKWARRSLLLAYMLCAGTGTGTGGAKEAQQRAAAVTQSLERMARAPPPALPPASPGEPSEAADAAGGSLLVPRTQLGAAVRRVLQRARADGALAASLRDASAATCAEIGKCVTARVELVCSTLEQHRLLSAARQYSLARVDKVCTEAQTLSQKLRKQQYTMLLQTYTPDNVARLQRLRNELEQQRGVLQGEIARASSTLERYRGAPPAYLELVRQYTDVATRTDNHHWVLANFGSGSLADTPDTPVTK